MAVDPRLDDPDWLKEQYWGEGMSLRDIADEAGASDHTVRRRLLEHGLGTRGPPSVDPRLDDPEWLEDRYEGQGMTTYDIAEETGAAHMTVLAKLYRHGVETRPPGKRARAPRSS